MQRKLFFLACFFVCAKLYSQQYPFVYYTPKEGLINSRVRRIKQDSFGRMYFITYGGLSVYDGVRFSNYNQQTGLANEVVNDAIEISNDSVLVSTNTQKLNTLVHGKIANYQTEDGFYPVVNRFFKSTGSRLYATADDGFYLLKERKFCKLSLTKNGKDLSDCLDKVIGWENYFLLQPWNANLPQKLILYNAKSGKVDDVFSEQTISGFATDDKDNVWIVTAKGIYTLDNAALRNGKLKLMPFKKTFALAGQSNVNIYFDKQGTRWLFAGNRIENSTTPGLSLSPAQGLKASNLSDIFFDREGILWMASDGGGVVKLPGTNLQLLNTVSSTRAMSFSAIETTGDTALLYDVLSHGIYSVTRNQTTTIYHFKKNTVQSITAMHGRLYLSDANNLFEVRQNSSNTITNAQDIFHNPLAKIGQVLADPFGALILHIQKSGENYLLYVVKNKQQLAQYQLPYLCDQMQLDSGRRLWLVTRNDHLMLFTLHPNDPKKYLQLVRDFATDIGNISPRSIAIDGHQNVWVGTRYNGLYQFVLKNERLVLTKHYTTREGLTDNFICCLSCDKQNTVWIGTQTGLDKLFVKEGEVAIANISKTIGCFQRVTLIKITTDGTAWALNNDGTVLKILPETSSALKALQPSLLATINVNDKSFDTSHHSFAYNQNTLSLDVAAPSFFDEKSIHYRYRLEGGNSPSWSEPSNTATFRFINLAAGDYTLTVRCDFPAAVYPPRIFRYTFSALPPWWQTTWFRILACAVLVLLLILAIRSYYKRRLQKQKVLLERKQAIEKERTRIATDMHDDLGAGLTRIKFLSEIVGIKKQQHQPIEEDIGKIREYSHEMISKMGEIVWALNEKNDSLSDLLSFTRSYAADYLSQNGIKCITQMPENVPVLFVSGEFRRNVFLSVKEILHNVVKHAQADAVNIVVQADHHLAITVRDNGIGFDQQNMRAFSNGISNIKKRIGEINGRCQISSMKGTIVQIDAPLPT